MLSCQIIFQRATKITQKLKDLPNSDYVKAYDRTLFKAYPMLIIERKDGYVYGQMMVENIIGSGNIEFKNFKVKDYGDKFICKRANYYFNDVVIFDVDYTKDLIKMVKEFSTKKYWASWNQYTNDWRPLNYPTNHCIIGYWCSGYAGSTNGQGYPTYSTVCAVIEANSKEAAIAAILEDWPEATHDVWRFFDEKPIDWRPGDRFR